ncbi:MAG: beta-N-acetylhexosaminidase [Alphaproteobacteria bacterium]|nr:beta-N-acetylhexosaminidase [Alphaproteobacteria bacterium]
MTEKRPLPVIWGCSGTSLSQDEYYFFEKSNPFGFILFKRNCNNPEQVRSLVKELRQAVGRPDAPILIDQEGGRVARLQPPHWAKYPAARLFGQMYETDPEDAAEAIAIYTRIVAYELNRLGINVNCAPVLDLFMPGATSAIGDRAYSRKPAVVAALARTMAETFMENGILPVLKHMPGHGRLRTDPHEMLPVIEATVAELESDDFVPFTLLKDLPIAMNSHAVFTQIDASCPASLSTVVHQDIIREKLEFDGLLLSDDLTMKALHGRPDDLARRALGAGSDVVLHCNGFIEEMRMMAAALKPMQDESWSRWLYAQSMIRPMEKNYRPAADIARLDILLGAVAFTAETA